MSHKLSAASLLILILWLLAMSSSDTSKTPHNFSVVQWNPRGKIESKIPDIINTLGFYPDIFAMQETLLNKETTLSSDLTKVYNAVRHGERPQKMRNTVGDKQKRGIITLIKKMPSTPNTSQTRRQIWNINHHRNIHTWQTTIKHCQCIYQAPTRTKKYRIRESRNAKHIRKPIAHIGQLHLSWRL